MKKTDSQTGGHIDRQTDRQTDRRTDRRTDKEKWDRREEVGWADSDWHFWSTKG